MPDQIRMQSSGVTERLQPDPSESQQLESHQLQEHHRQQQNSQYHPQSQPPIRSPAAVHPSSGLSEKSSEKMREERIDVMMETSGMVHGQPLPRMGAATFVPRRRNFVQRNCGFCISLVKWLPVLFITSVVCWGYYAYTIQLCFFNIDSVMLRIILLIPFHMLTILTLWSYLRTIFTAPGKAPREFWLTTDDMDALNAVSTEPERQAIFHNIVAQRNIPVATRNYSGSFRVCEKCNLIKPDRAHHCSVCDCCVLKMDHHCPWVNNCVSFTNYKFFILFLGYAFMLCLFVAGTSFSHFLRFWKHDHGAGMGKLHVMFLFFVSIMFAVSLASLFFYHIFLTLKNRSTLESFRTPIFRYGPDRKAYDLGKKENWEEIFGDSPATWFLPVTSSLGDGLSYRMSHKPDAGIAESGGFPPQSAVQQHQRSVTGDQLFPPPQQQQSHQYKSDEQMHGY